MAVESIAKTLGAGSGIDITSLVSQLVDAQFANKTAEDLKLLCRFNEVARLMKALDALPADHPIRSDPAFEDVQRHRYFEVPRIVAITRPEQAGGFDGSDFSAETIGLRADEGYAQTAEALRKAGLGA